MKDKTPWGVALDKLRDKRSLRSMETSGLIGIAQYKKMRASKLGPSVAVLDRWLKGMGYTWHDWASAYEPASQSIGHPVQLRLCDPVTEEKHQRTASIGQDGQ